MNSSVLSFLSGGLLMVLVLCQAGAQQPALPQRLTPPPGSVSFGAVVRVLANGNIVVTDPDYSIPGPEPVERAGAVHLYDGATLELISTLTGSLPEDHAGQAWIDELPGGNYVVTHYNWRQKTGAVTWCSGTAGLSGQVSAANSLTGTRPGDQIGSRQLEAFGNGDYAVRSPDWNESRGAVTWGSGTSGVTGEITVSNSLIGSKARDSVGNSALRRLPNGNFLVYSSLWKGRSGSGALTWVDAHAPITGEVSAANSLVGMGTGLSSSDRNFLIMLKNGNYVVQAPEWNRRQGAVTWGSGTSGVIGEVSVANSLLGTGTDSLFSWNGIIELASGNFLVYSPDWNGKRGAVTWVDGAKGASGVVSAANSLINASPSQGGLAVYPLANGNYVTAFPTWGGSIGPAGQWMGAVVWGSGTEGVRGAVSTANALTGTQRYDNIGSGGITALANGNYVVNSPRWSEARGAATWCDGGKPVTGEVSAINSLTGGAPSQAVGTGSTALTDGHYVVRSPGWNDGAGAVTWCNGATGRTGEVSEADSLTGNSGAGEVFGDNVGSLDSVALANGNYVAISKDWGGGRGAVTWCRGGAPVTGKVTEANSLTGNDTYRSVGSLGVRVLGNGGYLVKSPRWQSMGAYTWGSGTEGVRGEVSAANSLLTSGPDDLPGFAAAYPGSHGVIPLPGGGYMLKLPGWNGQRGALVVDAAETGVSGEISAANALVGATPNDRVGKEDVRELSGGAFLAVSPDWNDKRGAVTWGSRATGLSGEVSAVNSLTGSRPGDQAGLTGIIELGGGNYLVGSRLWNGGVGAMTWCGGMAGLTGEITSANSLLGTRSFPLTMVYIQSDENGGYAGAGADRDLLAGVTEARELFILGDGAMGTVGYPTPFNSIRGSLNPVGRSATMSWDRERNRWIAGCGSDNLVLLFSPVRGIRITGGPGADVLDESIPARRRATDFGPVAVDGGRRVHTFDVVDAGTRRLVLTGDTPVRVTGADAGDFTVTRQPSWLSGEAAHPTFDITFNPSGPGPRAAVVSIASNADGRDTLTFPIRGEGASSAREVFEGWRAGSFGDATEGTAPAEDFDGDGLSNLLEFAFDTDPADNSGGPVPLDYNGPLTAPGGDGVLAAHGIPLLVRAQPAGQDGGPPATLVWLRRRDAPGAGLKYAPQFSADLQTWQPVTAEPMVLAEDGTTEAVAVPFPADPADNGGDGGPGERPRFFRLAVTLEP